MNRPQIFSCGATALVEGESLGIRVSDILQSWGLEDHIS